MHCTIFSQNFKHWATQFILKQQLNLQIIHKLKEKEFRYINNYCFVFLIMFYLRKSSLLNYYFNVTLSYFLCYKNTIDETCYISMSLCAVLNENEKIITEIAFPVWRKVKLPDTCLAFRFSIHNVTVSVALKKSIHFTRMWL